MPLVNPVAGNPYPTIEQVMNLARVRVNDASNSIEGDLLTDDAPYTQTLLNSAWRWLQARAYSAGVETPIQEAVLYGVPVQASQDPANQAYLTWIGCSDGVNQFDTPALPQNLIQPLSVWRRQSNGSPTENPDAPLNTAMFNLMEQATDGLPVWLNYNIYDWRADGLYFYANAYAQDFRIRYAAFRPDLIITRPTDPVPMMMCDDCLSARIAYEYANLRGAPQAGQMQQLAEDAFNSIAQRTSRRKQRQSLRRIPYNRRGYGVPFGFPPTAGN